MAKLKLVLGTYCDSYKVVHGHSHNFFVFFERHIVIYSSSIFSEQWGTPQWEHLFGPQLQNKNKCIPWPIAHLFNLYTWELNFGQTIWNKTKVLLGTSYGMYLRTLWEHDGHTLRTKKKKTFFPCLVAIENK